jgi:hypothetical protein
MEEMNVDFNDPGSTPPASGVPESLTEGAMGACCPSAPLRYTTIIIRQIQRAGTALPTDIFFPAPR